MLQRERERESKDGVTGDDNGAPRGGVPDAKAEDGCGAALEADPGGGALGLRLYHAPKGLSQLRSCHSTARPRAPKRRMDSFSLSPFLVLLELVSVLCFCVAVPSEIFH